MSTTSSSHVNSVDRQAQAFRDNPPRARTKIVSTIGPACRSPEQLQRIIRAGTDVIRLNTAHGTFDEFAEVIAAVRESESEFGPVGVLLDLAGPKIRLGTLAADSLQCDIGQVFRFTPGAVAKDRQSLTCDFPQLLEVLEPGNLIVLADGQVALKVESVANGEIHCRVVTAGTIRSKQGINVPGAKLALPALTDADRRWLQWSGLNDVDYLGLSFVRQAADVLELRSILEQMGHSIPIVAKVEKIEALSNLDAIVVAADAVMVARGDLGVEIDIADVPMVQKRIIARCNELLTPVIVATQMLDSMQQTPRPTRAEVTDVANAVLDGADACMLSGETAIGNYSVESVEMMNRILLATESSLRQRPPVTRAAHQRVDPVTHALATAAGQVTSKLDVRLMAVVTRTGITALTKSSLRDFVPTLAISGDVSVLRRMTLWWGVVPVAARSLSNRQELLDFIQSWGQKAGLLAPGDMYLLVTGTGLFADVHSQLSVHRVPAP